MLLFVAKEFCSQNKTEKGENPVQKTHLHPCDWKEPGGFAGQKFPKFAKTAEYKQAPPRAAPARREQQSSCFASARTCCCVSFTHASFFTETGVSDGSYENN